MLVTSQHKEEYNMYETYREQVAIQSAPSIQGAANAQSNAALNLVKSFNQAAQGVSNVIQVESAIQEKQDINQANDEALQDIADGNLSYKEGETKAVESYNKLIAGASQAKLQNELKLGISDLSTQYANDVVGFNQAADEFLNSVVEGQAGSLETQANLKVYGNNLKRGSEVAIAQRQVTLTKEVAKSDIILNLSNKGEDILTNARSGDMEVSVNLYQDLQRETEQLVLSGDISAEKRASILSNTEKSMYQESLLGEFDSAIGNGLKDAEDYIEQLEVAQRNGDDIGLDPTTLDRTISTMKAEYNNELRSLQSQQAAYDKANKDKIELELYTTEVSSAITSGVPLDYKNTDDKKAVNKVFDSRTGEWSMADPAQQQAAVDFSTQTGVVPEKVISKIRTAVYAGNPEAARAGVDLLNRLITDNPALTEQFSDKDVAYATGVDRLQRAGVPIEEALSIQKEWLTRPIQERKKEVMSGYQGSDFNDEVTQRVDNFIDANFDNSWFSSQPEASQAMKADYSVVYEKYLTLTGNPDDAAVLTNKKINNKWGVTYINGEPEMMAYPPEKMLAGSAEEQQWIQDDIANVKESIAKGSSNFLVGEEAYKVTLVADAKLMSGGVPRYLVMIQDENGIYSPHLSANGNPMYWTASYKDSKEYKESIAEQEAKVASAKERAQSVNQYQDEAGEGGISQQLANARKAYNFVSR